MTRRTESRLVLLIVSLLACTSASAAVIDIFSDRSAFESQLENFVVDDYTNSSYMTSMTDTEMSAVLGETRYTATQFLDFNSVVTDGTTKFYCSGCNGTFLLDFTATSVGDSNGIFGVGLEIERNNPTLPRVAFVTFGDGTSANIGLPAGFFSSSFEFWGITSPDKIGSIHFGLPDGQPTSIGSFVITNLTIGSRADAIPEPSVLFLLGTGIIGVIAIPCNRRMGGVLIKRSLRPRS